MGEVCPAEELCVAEFPPPKPLLLDWLLDGNAVPALVETCVRLIVDDNTKFPVDKDEEDDQVPPPDGLFEDTEFEKMPLRVEKRPLEDVAVTGLPEPPPDIVVGTDVPKDDCPPGLCPPGFPVPPFLAELEVSPLEVTVACIDGDSMEFPCVWTVILPPLPRSVDN